MGFACCTSLAAACYTRTPLQLRPAALQAWVAVSCLAVILGDQEARHAPGLGSYLAVWEHGNPSQKPVTTY